MFLHSDAFNRSLLFGKIPGSASERDKEQINIISIQNVNCTLDEPLQIKECYRAGSPILDEFESVHESNAFNIAKELNNFDAMGIQITTREEDDCSALETFNSNMTKDK